MLQWSAVLFGWRSHFKEVPFLNKRKKFLCLLVAVFLLAALCCVPALAAGDVAGAMEDTWKSAAQQIKTVVNNVVFPALDMILAILLFVKIGSAYLDYRKHGQMEWTAPAILFACLIFTLTAPNYIWGIVGM